MIKLLLGLYAEDSWVVRYMINFTKKEANQLLDNVLYSTNIYGQKNSSSKKDIAFTLPIMYLPGFTHGRIYFKFNTKSSEKIIDPLIINILSQPINNSSPISVFLSFEKLNDSLETGTISEIDILIWNFLRSELTETNFQNLASKLELLTQSITKF